jgi:hypothetical protein
MNDEHDPRACTWLASAELSARGDCPGCDELHREDEVREAEEREDERSGR